MVDIGDRGASAQSQRKGAVAPCSWSPEESQVESCEHQDNANIHCQPFPESVSEEREIYTDYDRRHRHHVKHDNYLSAHFSEYQYRGFVTRGACPQFAGQVGGHVPGDFSREMNSGSSDASYTSIAASVALCLRSSNTILSYVSRLVCQVYEL